MNDLDCAATRAELVAFLDGELAGSALNAVERHLSSCSECVAVRDSLDDVWSALDHLPGLEPRPGWLAEVEQATVNSGVPKRGLTVAFPLRRLFVAVAVAACLAIGVGLVFLSSRPPEATDPELVVMGPAPRGPEGSGVDLPPQVTDLPPQVTDLPVAIPAVEQDVPLVADAFSGTDPDPELDGLSDAELEMIAELEVLVLLDELDELEVLEALEFLDDLDEDELSDET